MAIASKRKRRPRTAKKTVYWTCAFCEKAVKESQTLTVLHEGLTYYTCSPRCRERLLVVLNRYTPAEAKSK